ncbi:MAG: hypothetical protein HY059_22115 [Proteobacteria bacterium]|nr:hypothetical protein [Pseudomonadota bacterium]
MERVLREPRSAAIAAFIAFHFLMLAMGMLRRWLPAPWGPPFQLAYARITGGGGSFGFFSPNVPREISVWFEIQTADGRTIQETVHQVTAPEVQARVVNMTHLLGKNFERKEIVRSVAASLAASQFRRRDDARAVTVHADFYDFPAIKDYRPGQEFRRVSVYAATFNRKAGR